jgi:ureidoglycolate hydrolase
MTHNSARATILHGGQEVTVKQHTYHALSVRAWDVMLCTVKFEGTADSTWHAHTGKRVCK